MTYNSREEAVSSVSEDGQRVQYDEGDADRIKDVAGTFAHHTVELIESLGAYAAETKTEVDEDSELRMGYARRDLIEKWAVAQLALSKVAYIIRVDGNQAYDRLVAALNIEGGNIDMRGL